LALAGPDVAGGMTVRPLPAQTRALRQFAPEQDARA
jgi:hypothetical protein